MGGPSQALTPMNLQEAHKDMNPAQMQHSSMDVILTKRFFGTELAAETSLASMFTLRMPRSKVCECKPLATCLSLCRNDSSSHNE
eukprot:6472032-Amphidinium_carterae.1